MCTCTEDKYGIVNGVEVKLDGTETLDQNTPIIGRNKVVCQECINQSLENEKQRAKEILIGKIKELEGKIFYSQLDGATEFANAKIAERLALKQQLIDLG